MKKILYTILLAISFMALMIFDSCDIIGTDSEDVSCAAVYDGATLRIPKFISPEDQAIFIGPQRITLEWSALSPPRYDEHYRLYVDTIAFNVMNLPEYEYTLESTFITDTLEAGTYYWAVYLFTECHNCGLMMGPNPRSFTILPLVDSIKLLEPQDGAFDIDLGKSLEWDLISMTGNTGYTFDVYLDENDPPSTLVGSDISELFFKPVLTARSTYYWKVVGKLNNEEDIESEIWSFTTLNNPPDAFDLSLPENEATNVALDTKLEWLAATDPNGDPVTYDVWLDTSNPPEVQVAFETSDVFFMPTTESGTTYYWQVIAKDDMGAATESEIWSFTTLNNPPAAAVLTSPDNGAVDVALDVTLEWQASIDPDGNEVSYDVLLDMNHPPQALIATDIAELFFTTTVATGTTYYWQVISKDDKGASTESEIWNFKTGGSISYDVVLLKPENEAVDVPLYPELTWKLNVSAGDAIYEYDIYLDTTSPPTVKAGSYITDMAFWPWPALSAGMTYYWKVVGIDHGSGKKVESAEWKFTTVSGSE